MLRSLPRTLLLLTLAHALVDAFGMMVQPLWPHLQRSLAIDDVAMQGLFILWQLGSSISQLAFGYWCDRIRGRWMVPAGAAVAIVGMSLIGQARSAPALGALLVLSGLGIAAFHPEAASLAGAAAPRNRARAMSLFSVGGSLGIAIGPIYSGVVTTRLGLPALVWSMTWGLAMLGVLCAGLGRDESPRPMTEGPTAVAPVALVTLLRGRGRSVALVLLIGILRTLPMTGLPLAIAYLIELHGGSTEQIGVIQSVFAVGIGVGSFGCAVWLREVHERRALWSLPVLAAPFLATSALATGLALKVCVLVGGFLLGAAIPILTSYGQRLLHDAQRVASALTMGVTWGVGGVIVAALMAALNHAGRPGLALPVFAVAALASGLLCAWLPDAAPEPAPARPATAVQPG